MCARSKTCQAKGENVPNPRRDNARGQSTRERCRDGREKQAEIATYGQSIFPGPGCRLRVVVDKAQDVSASLVRTDETMSNAQPDTTRGYTRRRSRGERGTPRPAWLERRRGICGLGRSRRRGNLGEEVTCGCVLESTPTWFPVETVECSCGTRPTNFPSHPDVVRYSVRGWSSGEDASLARPAVGNT